MVINLKKNSKFMTYFYSICIIALVVFSAAVVVSSVSAADNLVKGNFSNDDFSIDVPSGSDFGEEATTSINVGDLAMNMEVFLNHGDNAKDLGTVMYLKDSSSNQSIISDAVNDLKNEGPIVEENDKYFVVETKDSNNFFNFDIGNDLDSLFSFVDGFFSSDSDVNVSTQDADVQVSANEGINIVDENGSTFSLSEKGLFVSDENGENVSIDSTGVKVSENNGSGEASEGDNVSVHVDSISDVQNGDYALCIESPSNDQLIVITGNNLDLMKSMADTASFK